MIGGFIANKIGLKPTMILGCLIYCGGWALTFFSLDVGIWACFVTLSIPDALGQSICYYVAVATAMKWFPGRTGLTGSICIAGFGY